MTPRYSPMLWWPQNKIHKIFIPKKIILLKTPKNIDIQTFEPPKMAQAYVCMKISESSPQSSPPPPGWSYARHYVRPDLGPNSLQMFSADDTGWKQRVKSKSFLT